MKNLKNITKDSYPYLTGMGLRNRSHLIFDEFQQDPASCITKEGQVVFLKTDFIDVFFNNIIHTIKHKIKIITQNSSLGVEKRHSVYLNNEKVLIWYAQNANFYHPKLQSIPLGIANARWPHGNINEIEEVKSSENTKDYLVYMNFDVKTNPNKRQEILDMFKGKDFVLNGEKKPFKQYLTDLSKSKFTVSPPGHGIDCHRIWESIAVGTIPIVENCHNISFHRDCPIMIIDDWQTLTKEFLEHKYEFYKSSLYTNSKIYLDYWINQIGLKQNEK